MPLAILISSHLSSRSLSYDNAISMVIDIPCQHQADPTIDGIDQTINPRMWLPGHGIAQALEYKYDID